MSYKPDLPYSAARSTKYVSVPCKKTPSRETPSRSIPKKA